MMIKKRSVILLAYLLLIPILILDKYTSTSYAEWVFYVIPVILITWYSATSSTLFFTTFCSVLIVLGAFISPSADVPISVPIFNRTVGIISLWTVMLLMRSYSKARVEISELTRAEDALRKSEEIAHQRAEELEKMMDMAPIGIWVSQDPDCRSIIGNRAAYQMYESKDSANLSAGTVAGEVLNTERRFFSGSRELKPEEMPMQMAAAKGEDVSNFEMSVLLPSGRWITTLGNARPLFDDKNRVRGCMGLYLDITERKLIEDELQNRNLQLANANADLDAFAHSVSHDLRAPVRKIMGFANTLLDEAKPTLDDGTKDCLARIIKNSQRMNTLIDDMLKLSTISRQKLHLQNIDLSRIASSVMNELRQAQSNRQVDVMIEENMRAFADEGLVTIALRNLLDNAWKYTSKAEHPKIEIKSIQQEGHTIFLICDNGVGFKVDPENLFKPFARFTNEPEYQGHGIGLSIVDRAIRKLGGKIWAESEPGKGATFSFYLREPATKW